MDKGLGLGEGRGPSTLQSHRFPGRLTLTYMHACMHTCMHTPYRHACIHNLQAGSVLYPEVGARRTLLINGYTSYVEAVNAQIMGFVNTAEGIALEKR